MKKAILPIILGYSAIIMLSGCKTSNDELNSSNVINSDILSESSSSQSNVTTSPNNKDNETNSSSTESGSEENSSSVSSTSDKNQSNIAIGSSSAQSSVTTSSSNKDDETNSSSSESRDENNSSNVSDINNSNITSESNNSQTDIPNTSNSESNETNSQPSSSNSNVSEPGKVEIIDELLELKRDGQARGEIEAGMKIDYRKATLTKVSNVTFNVDCKQKLTNIKITLTDRKTGKLLEGNVIGKGEISFDIDTDGEYIVTIENCSDKGTYFTIEYRINDKANTI